MQQIKSEISFSIEKLNKSIKRLNILVEIENNNLSEKDEMSIKKSINYIKKYSEWIKSSEDSEKIVFLKQLLNISLNSFKIHGDDLTESLWNLYDCKSFHIFSSNSSFTYYEFFVHLFFQNCKNIDILMKHGLFLINKENKKIDCHFSVDKYHEIECEFKFELENTQSQEQAQKNFLIDLVIFLILTNADIKGFYTSLSSFIITTNSSVMLLLKVISLFALCLWQLEKKENFVPSLIYTIAGVLRDHGRSYLKTKGVLNENLSYHKCTKKGSHENQFFSPQYLTTKECDYLELYFLPIMKEFLKLIVSHIDYDNLSTSYYWDDYLPIYYKNLELENMDNEDVFTAEVQIFHFLNVFLSEFLFFFITNFCEYEEKNFRSKFSGFHEFLNFALTIIWKSCRNVNSIFTISDKKRRFFEIECEKTEYNMLDLPNHYGICLIFYSMFSGKYNPIDLNNHRDPISSYLPLVVSKNHYFNLFQSMLYMILKSENSSEYRFFKSYQTFCWDLLENILKMFNDPYIVNLNFTDNKLIACILYEFMRFDLFRSDLVNSFVEIIENKNTLLEEMIKLTNKPDDVKKLYENFSNLIQIQTTQNFKNILRILVFNTFIINTDIKNNLRNLFSSWEKSDRNESIESQINEIGKLTDKENIDKDLELFMKHRMAIIEALNEFIII